MPSWIGVYEYRFVPSDFEGDGKPWEHVAMVLAAKNPERTWTEEDMKPMIDAVARVLDNLADHLFEQAQLCSHADPPCSNHPAKDGVPWCIARSITARGNCRAPDRQMLVRIQLAPLP